MPPNRVDTTLRVSELRDEMTAQGFKAYYVPLDEQGRRSWISGFTGSSGDAIVTMDQVLLQQSV